MKCRATITRRAVHDDATRDAQPKEYIRQRPAPMHDDVIHHRTAQMMFM